MSGFTHHKNRFWDTEVLSLCRPYGIAVVYDRCHLGERILLPS